MSKFHEVTNNSVKKVDKKSIYKNFENVQLFCSERSSIPGPQNKIDISQTPYPIGYPMNDMESEVDIHNRKNMTVSMINRELKSPQKIHATYSSCSALDMMGVVYEDEETHYRPCVHCFKLQSQLSIITNELSAIKSQISLLIECKLGQCMSPNTTTTENRKKRRKLKPSKAETNLSNRSETLNEFQNNTIATLMSIEERSETSSFSMLPNSVTGHKNLEYTQDDTGHRDLSRNYDLRHQNLNNTPMNSNSNMNAGNVPTISKHPIKYGLGINEEVFNQSPTKISHDNTNQNCEATERAAAYKSEQCIIVKGLPECDDPIAKNRITQDIRKFKEYALPLLRGDERIEICKAIRLGRERSMTSPRPLKLILRSKEQRDFLLQRKSILNEGGFKVFFQQEYSPREREKYRELYQQMKMRMQCGEKYLTIRNGEIVKKEYSYLWTSPVVISPQD
ncbi:MAG: hypothetical protein ACRC7W_06380 [Fusobacteriaceae bacterium]